MKDEGPRTHWEAFLPWLIEALVVGLLVGFVAGVFFGAAAAHRWW